ncbi:polyphosphate:AMP phosphotransferase [Pseudogemmatithrix spongiicola]|uniref:Polyphosphate:AMP phosphotransferase n=1 Tax=Pseudogemmatithrix spongiicola TaxID=3062599 RepID=A0AA49K0Y7_9BACT|nr:polyphosphate:AMP phosphotransferase [Gemmatimonadaceae bacterium 'strain 138']WKW15591.1 polyphosphate:AMP phosphotransferase [Gemmatimonadaceae bacterium 'strain 318']
MLDAAEQGLTLTDRAYERQLRTLRPALLKAHFALQQSGRQVLVIVSGSDGAGKGELVHRLNEWLDPRGVTTTAFWDHSDEEDERPHFYRFWRAMPGAGKIGIFFGSWYTRPIIDRVTKSRRKRDFVPELDRIVAFEKMLADGGIHVLKLWLHLSKPAQRQRLKELERLGRLGPDDWKHFKQYDRFRTVSELALEHTHQPHAPWHPVDATDRRHREITAAKLLLATLEHAATLEAPKRRARAAAPAARTWVPGPSQLDQVDLTQRLTVSQYERELPQLQERLSRLAWRAREEKVPTILAFEGWDAAGKGSAIRRVTQALDPRLYRVVGIAAPTDEERAQHYLWRFWRHVPRDGRITIFDRTWYGRVLVERVEGFAPVADWDRAYFEIDAFERQLVDHGAALGKFWIHISPAEQLKRFKERQRVAWKRHKITDEDWRNRKKLPAYKAAVDEMLARCSPGEAPFTVVAGDDKRFARVQILRTIVERLEGALEAGA